MSFDESTKKELEGILALVSSDAYDSDAKQRLAKIVGESDDARRIYLEHCQMHAMLHQSTLLSAFHAERVVSPLQGATRRQSLFAWAGLAVAVCAVFILGLTAAQFFGGDSDDGDPVAAPRIAFVQAIEGIAVCGDGKVTEGTKLMNGTEVSRGIVRVESGSMSLRFDNGTVLLVEGPAELSIESDMQVSLKRGRLAAHMSEDAYGFTVLGPDSAVIDLGTEFAMAVKDGESWVEVYDGEVDVALLNDDGLAWKSRELSASGPVRIDASRGKILDEAPPTALPRLTDAIPEGLAVPSEYVTAVLNRKPAHYWRFDEAGGGQVADVVGDATAAISGGTQLKNGGLHFPGGRKNHGIAFIAEPLPSLISDEFTLEIWVHPSFTQRRGLIGINHRAADSLSQTQLYRVELLPHQHQTVFPGETFEFVGNLWPFGEDGVVRAFSANQYRIGAWHHVVAVRRERQLEIYLNGEKAKTSPAPPLNSSLLPAAITIGRSFGPETEKRRRDRYFKGMVDEFAVYASALSSEEVAEHYRLMQVEIP